MIKQYDKPSDIPARNYEGYIWMSDEKKKPKILKGTKYEFSSLKINPFVIEGLLYCRESETSIMIRHTGKYHIIEYNLKDLKSNHDLIDTEYLPHKLEGVKKVCFKQIWTKVKDENCMGWPVLEMKALVFTGFKN
jgi:CRISPR type III-associated protein (TIGR04423 family)